MKKLLDEVITIKQQTIELNKIESFLKEEILNHKEVLSFEELAMIITNKKIEKSICKVFLKNKQISSEYFLNKYNTDDFGFLYKKFVLPKKFIVEYYEKLLDRALTRKFEDKKLNEF